MIEEVKTPEQEDDVVRKAKSKKRIRGLLIVINALLASYLTFEITAKIINSVNHYINADGEIILLNDKNAEESMEVYNKYVLKDEVSSVYDYGIYGYSLHLSSSRIDVNNYSSFDTLAVRNISSSKAFNSSMNKVIEGNYLNGGIDLSQLEVGEHLVLDTVLTADVHHLAHKGVKVRSEEGMNKTLYTLPDSQNQRKRIKVRSKESSPCLVISVDLVPSIPTDYYDIVLFGEEELTSAYQSSIPANVKVYRTDSLLEAYKVNASICIAIDDALNKPLVSQYIKDDGLVFDHDVSFGGDSLISSQDKNKIIRELGGHLTKAGMRIKDIEETFDVAISLGDHDNGKYVSVVPSTMPYQDIINLML